MNSYLTYKGLHPETKESIYEIVTTTGPDTIAPDTTTAKNMNTTKIDYLDTTKAIPLNKVKIGDYFARNSGPLESQVLVRGEYDRQSKTFCCHYFSDVNRIVFIKGTKLVFTNFEF